MPIIPTSPTSFFGGVTDFLGDLAPLVQTGINIAGQFGAGPAAGGFQTVGNAVAMPGGAPLGGGFQQTVGIPFYDLVPDGSTAITPTAGSCGPRLPSTVDVPYTTASGHKRIAHYKNLGRAVLYQGDFAAAKRVKKVGAKARRRSGGR